jgi:hypothetical protein
MKEAEAYKLLGWPIEGDESKWILPVTGQDDECIPFQCECGDWSGIAYGGSKFQDTCPRCGKKMKEITA